ncbi:MAG: GMP/IMP nucleotidase [Arenicella sp.]|nr:GMP/IMP nucleotidase [Arenicella sp.]
MYIDWSNIETVLLDMDGTLLDLHFDSHFWLDHLPQVYAQKHQLSDEEVQQIMMPLFENHAGTLNWYCVEFWSDALGLDIMQHKQEVSHKIGYRPAAQGFLQRCREQVDDLRLITNAHREVLNLKIEHTKLDQYFDQMVCSHELGAPKEQLEFWSSLHSMQGFDPDSTLFIDDSETVLDAAHAFGIGHIFSIAEPDSQRERAQASKFPMLTSFTSAQEAPLKQR